MILLITSTFARKFLKSGTNKTHHGILIPLAARNRRFVARQLGSSCGKRPAKSLSPSRQRRRLKNAGSLAQMASLAHTTTAAQGQRPKMTEPKNCSDRREAALIRRHEHDPPHTALATLAPVDLTAAFRLCKKISESERETFSRNPHAASGDSPQWLAVPAPCNSQSPYRRDHNALCRITRRDLQLNDCKNCMTLLDSLGSAITATAGAAAQGTRKHRSSDSSCTAGRQQSLVGSPQCYQSSARPISLAEQKTTARYPAGA